MEVAMAVKTITIDMDAYTLLAEDKRSNESFSKVIKRRMRKTITADQLLARLAGLCLSDSTLNRTARLVKERKKNLVNSPSI